ncbi:unnamed protein product, partial [Oikopleura dioica]
STSTAKATTTIIERSRLRNGRREFLQNRGSEREKQWTSFKKDETQEVNFKSRGGGDEINDNDKRAISNATSGVFILS